MQVQNNRIPYTRVTAEGTVYDPTAVTAEVSDPDSEAIEQQQRALLVKVYSLMLLGLMISAVVSFWTVYHPEFFEQTIRHMAGLQVMFVMEIAAVAYITKYVEKLTIPMAWILFVFYAVFNGISFGVFFLFLPPAAVAFGFAIAAVTFGIMAAYGHSTGRDLGAPRNIAIMAVVGVALMVLINIGFGNGNPFYATAFLGLMFFSGLTSYHVQHIRDFDWAFEDDDAENHKAALVGALLIYLDFVNLYLMFVRLFGAMQSRRIRA